MDDPERISPRTLDELARRLRTLRESHGGPSFSEITRRVIEVRADRGAHPRDRMVGRMTVYDCFRSGRQRIDVMLVHDIVRALGADEDEADMWRQWSTDLVHQGPLSLPRAVRGSLTPAEPFVPRGDALERLIAAGRAIVTGKPGVGKTQLAAHALTELWAARTIRDIVSVDLRTAGQSSGPREVADAIVRALGRPLGASMDDRAFLDAAAEIVTQERVGLLIDDAVEAGALGPFLHVVETPTVVVSRTAVDPPPGWQLVEAAPWARECVTAHLRRSLDPGLCEAEPEEVHKLARSAGGLPLAADLIAARVGGRPGWSLADHVDELRERLDLPPGVLETSVGLSYSALSAEAQRALRLLAVVPTSGLSEVSTAALLDRTHSEATACVRELDAARLVEGCSPVYLHPLIRTVVAARSAEVDAPSDRRAAIDRLVDDLLERAWDAVAVLYPLARRRSRHHARPTRPGTEAEAAAFWRDELDVLLDLVAAVAERRPDVPVLASDVTTHHLEVDGRYLPAERLHRLALRCAQSTGDIDSTPTCAMRLGHVLFRLGDPTARIELERAALLARQSGNQPVLLTVSLTLGVLAATEQDHDDALSRFSQCLEIAERGDFPGRLPGIHHNIGMLLRRTGDLDSAGAHLTEAIRISLEEGDSVSAANALSNLSDVQNARGDHEDAASSARKAIRLSVNRAHRAEGYARVSLGAALAGQGDAAGAEEQFLSARHRAEEIDERSLIATVDQGLGRLSLSLGQSSEAAERFTAALNTARDFGDFSMQSYALTGLAECALAADDHDAARSHLVEAVDLFGTARSPEAVLALRLLGSLELSHRPGP